MCSSDLRRRSGISCKDKELDCFCFVFCYRIFSVEICHCVLEDSIIITKLGCFYCPFDRLLDIDLDTVTFSVGQRHIAGSGLISGIRRFLHQINTFFLICFNMIALQISTCQIESSAIISDFIRFDEVLNVFLIILGDDNAFVVDICNIIRSVYISVFIGFLIPFKAFGIVPFFSNYLRDYTAHWNSLTRQLSYKAP